jgi:hypothetical protein
VLTAFALAAVATVAGHAAGLVLLTGATLVLGAAAVLTLRAHWAAAAPAQDRVALPAVPSAVPADDPVTGDLRRLHDAHVEKVNAALDEGREDLARELADSYADSALALLTRG